MPAELYKIWKETERNPYIIHWTGANKPWIAPDEYLAYEWWNIARRTPYYEEIVRRNLVSVQSKPQTVPNINYPILVSLINKKKILLQYWKYRILRNFVFGEKRKEYSAKKNKFKQRYKDINDFIRMYKNAY